MNHIQADRRALCCNHQPDSPCSRVASLACKSCLMVAYCSKRCQRAHGPIHRKDCLSPIMKGTWKPRWVTENRPPTFMGDGMEDQVKFGTVKYLWGNVPAFDVIQLGQNEGVDFQNPINLLFAGSYKSQLNIVINDHDIDIVARNLIFLLIMLIEEDPNIAAESMLHVWYSALVTEACYTLLQKKLKPIIEDVCSKIVGRPYQTLFGKTWNFGGSSLRLVLTREAWMMLPSYFDVPRGMTKEIAQAVRQAVVNAPSRVDYVDRAVMLRSPAAGLGMIKYRDDGVLVPFGQVREAFSIPNPTFFESSNKWPMMDSADPTDGWSIKTFLATKAGPAKKDTYGQLHHYLKHLFVDFHRYLHSKPVAFELHHVDAKVLNDTLARREFDRIEVSNICDSNYLGIAATLKIFGPLLRRPSTNPHATLITAFLNAVPEAKMISQSIYPVPEAFVTLTDIEATLKYIGSDLTMLAERFAQTDAIKMDCAVKLVGDMDMYFDLYMHLYEFVHAALSAGVEMKKRHTIIPPWPLRVNGGLHPTQRDKEDFKLLLGSAHIGHERYVEWKVGAVQAAANTQLEKEEVLQLVSCLLS
ncbi:hypothetical protein F5Y09DRAFT_351075 [Xylaria sp. FL1042]|nr:hypothetical protein F5Y09DRAFT_351075 [Xylaria sp. FL1042]